MTMEFCTVRETEFLVEVAKEMNVKNETEILVPVATFKSAYNLQLHLKSCKCVHVI